MPRVWGPVCPEPLRRQTRIRQRDDRMGKAFYKGIFLYHLIQLTGNQRNVYFPMARPACEHSAQVGTGLRAAPACPVGPPRGFLAAESHRGEGQIPLQGRNQETMLEPWLAHVYEGRWAE